MCFVLLCSTQVQNLGGKLGDKVIKNSHTAYYVVKQLHTLRDIVSN